MLKYNIATLLKSLINQMGKRYCKKQKLGCNDPDNNLNFISLYLYIFKFFADLQNRCKAANQLNT